MTHNPCLLDYLDKKHSRRVKKFSTGQKKKISVQRTRKKNCGPREEFVKVFLATLSSVNDVIKPAKCVGLGPRTTNAFYTSVWQLQNHGYWNVQSVEQTHVFRNIGVLKLICENERTTLKTLADKIMCIDLKCPVESLDWERNRVYYTADIWRLHWSKWAYVLSLLEWN